MTKNGQQVACDPLDSTCNFEGNDWRRGVSGASLRDTEDAVLACDQDGGQHSILLGLHKQS